MAEKENLENLERRQNEIQDKARHGSFGQFQDFQQLLQNAQDDSQQDNTFTLRPQDSNYDESGYFVQPIPVRVQSTGHGSIVSPSEFRKRATLGG